ncbi:MAG: hemolysin III family protein [Proteobacteria bacterium]|nr:hemolysin III family protein [Pseudomonadota bacterium]
MRSPRKPPPFRSLASRELVADGVVHVLGVSLGLPAAVAAVVLASGRMSHLAAVALYAVGLLAMLGCSAAYHLSRTSPHREWLRRFDHAAIFAMIAGTYTPFTVRLAPGWAVGLTAGIWAVAALGIAVKLWKPNGIERLSTVLYLALGWIGMIAAGPFVEALPATTLLLMALGGVIYSAGVAFHLAHRLAYQNAIWHGFVLAAAGVHYCAVLTVT